MLESPECDVSQGGRTEPESEALKVHQ
jgi:hypothetical protein